MKLFNFPYFSIKNPALVNLVNIFLGMLLVVAFLFLTRDFITTAFNPHKKFSLSEKKSQTVRKHAIQDYALILKNNPFGFNAGELNIITSKTASMSNSDLSLIGTVSGRKGVSYAIFMSKTGEQEVFRIGDSVFGLGILNKVEKDRVFIESAGKKIDMPINDIVSIREIQKANSSETASSGFTKKLSDSTYLIDQKKIQQAIENPNELMTDARLIPNIVDGAQQGFKLSEVRIGGVYQSLGLQNNDVLLRINEYNISHPENALQAFTALRGMDRVQLDILRSGSKMTMTYQIR